ncbi:MAG: MBOAT family protein [Paludibacteraceae bacterium]|nr:MBOAT family protein [Paludibacteraceae bacterium]
MNDIIPGLLGYDSNAPLLFTQFFFWVFFGVVLAVVSAIGNRTALRNAFLCAASFFFYYKSSGLFILLLAITVTLCFFIGKLIGMKPAEEESRSGTRKFWLIIGLIANLGILIYYKYAYFLTNLVNDITGLKLEVKDTFAWIGNQVAGENIWSVDKILLPVGISFFIFQSISYLMDIYRGRIKPLSNLLDFGFFVSFFPQLVAGPIVRANTFMEQLHRPFFLGRRQMGIAVFWIINGLAKKIILSDYIAVNFVDRVFTNPDMYGGFETLWALTGYSLQVYADFSGYTDIATGVAMLMGFYLPQNFNSPYKAPNPGNFWKRWHISLSRWLQDYLYIPLGGNRNSTFGTYCTIGTVAIIGVIFSGSIWIGAIVGLIALAIALTAWLKPERRKKIITNLNSMDTMLLGGLWHGASWNFMIWGGLNGLGMVVFKFWKNRDVYIRTAIIMFVTLALICLDIRYDLPVFRIGAVWSGAIFIGTFIRMLYNMLDGERKFSRLENAWAIAQTFVFVTFTRLFFRSGSNLDPAEANKVAWNTAKTMMEQISNAWNAATIGEMLWAYRYVWGLIVIGLLIHWIPERTKRWYRINFALLPLPIMALIVVLVVFVVYQFKTADLQAFIYFQF